MVQGNSKRKAGQFHILIVIDDEQTLQRLKNMLDEEYAVTTAGNVLQGLERAQQDVDLLLFEQQLPIGSISRALEKVRENYQGIYVVKILDQEPEMDTVWLDYDDFLVRPIERENIEQVIERAEELLCVEELLQEYLRLRARRGRLEEELTTGDEMFHEAELDELSTRINELEERLQGELHRGGEKNFIQAGIRDIWYG